VADQGKGTIVRSSGTCTTGIRKMEERACFCWWVGMLVMGGCVKRTAGELLETRTARTNGALVWAFLAGKKRMSTRGEKRAVCRDLRLETSLDGTLRDKGRPGARSGERRESVSSQRGNEKGRTGSVSFWNWKWGNCEERLEKNCLAGGPSRIGLGPGDGLVDIGTMKEGWGVSLLKYIRWGKVPVEKARKT